MMPSAMTFMAGSAGRCEGGEFVRSREFMCAAGFGGGDGSDSGFFRGEDEVAAGKFVVV